MIEKFVTARSKDFDHISEERKVELLELSKVIKDDIAQSGGCNLTFICTHNSRRSQLAEFLCRTIANQLKIKQIHTYSGGTEATAFNIRMVTALQSAGFDFYTSGSADNPIYQYVSGNIHLNQPMFSKKYDHPYNPQSDYLAIMVCDHADENCPIVHGATSRIPLRYKDPKAHDDTPKEQNAYADKVNEIGREMVYLVEQVKK